MILNKIISTITSITNAIKEVHHAEENSASEVQASQSGSSDVKNVRRNDRDQSRQSSHGELCFSTTDVSQRKNKMVDQIRSTRFSAANASVSVPVGSVAICDTATGLCGGVSSRDICHCEPKGLVGDFPEEGGSLDPLEELCQQDELAKLDQKQALAEAMDIFDVQSFLSVKRPAFMRRSLGVHNPYASGVVIADDYMSDPLVAHVVESDAQAALPTEVVAQEALDRELPAFDEDDTDFVVADSFQAPDGTTVYISQPDDSVELEAA